MKNKALPLPNSERVALEKQLEAARAAVKHVEENGQTGTYYHELVARLEAALKLEDKTNGSQTE